MIVLKLNQKYDDDWLSLQFKKDLASIVFKKFPFKESYHRCVIAFCINGKIKCIGNLQAFNRIRNTSFFHVFVYRLFSFYPIDYPMKKNYEIIKLDINKKDNILRIGETVRKVRNFPNKFVFKV